MDNTYIEEKTEECFEEFSEEIKDYIIKSLVHLSQNNEQFIIELFELLCNIKKENPKFVIEFSNIGGSQFDCNSEKISLARKNYLIFIHEIAHAIHYYYNQYSVPNGFSELQNRIINSKQNTDKSKDFINMLDEKIKQISSKAYDPSVSDYEYDRLLLEQKCYLEAKDFIDAFFKGKTDFGHGMYYYSDDEDNKKTFSEMFATYISICSFDSNGTIIEKLRECLGDNVIDMIKQLYQEIKDQVVITNKSKR